ncbi:MAG: hypothetical protein DPW09_43695, partial [Anaerolineae bacterium]|nr:hypothetical protein [Anaerolineae bacterium]
MLIRSALPGAVGGKFPRLWLVNTGRPSLVSTGRPSVVNTRAAFDIDIAEQTTRPDGWTPIDRAGHLIKQRVPEEIASLKKSFGYKSLKEFILAAKIFDVYEEPSNNGSIRILYRKKP